MAKYMKWHAFIQGDALIGGPHGIDRDWPSVPSGAPRREIRRETRFFLNRPAALSSREALRADVYRRGKTDRAPAERRACKCKRAEFIHIFRDVIKYSVRADGRRASCARHA